MPSDITFSLHTTKSLDLREILFKKERVWLNVLSHSMDPLIPEDSTILVRHQDNGRPRFGDVVLFTDSEQIVVHRVLSVFASRGRFLQCGDNPVSPSWIPLDGVIGVVERVRLNGKERDLFTFPLRILNVMMGMADVGILLVKKIWPRGGSMLNKISVSLLSRVVGKGK